MIYHYTNVNAFFNIIKSNHLRLMPSIFTNDPYDCFWPKVVFDKVCNDLMKDELTDIQRNNLDLYFYYLQGGNLSLTPIKYFACFSKERDSLALWNRYGQNAKGIVLCFDDSRFNVKQEIPTGVNAAGTFNLVDMIYDVKAQYEFAKLFISLFKDKPIKDISFNEQLQASSFLYVMYTSFKNTAFSDEKELRLLFIPCLNDKVSKSFSDYISLNYSSNNERVIKFYDYKFPKESLKEIILGPEYAKDISFDVKKKEIQQFLATNGYTSCLVSKSDIFCRLN